MTEKKIEVRVGDYVGLKAGAKWVGVTRRFGVVTKIERYGDDYEDNELRRIHVQWDGEMKSIPISPGYLVWVGRSLIDVMARLAEEEP